MIKTDLAKELTGGMDMLKRDSFELLSAYLDGEVTADERRQVENWLDNDPEIQLLYGRLLKLRQGLRSIPAPPAQQPAEQTVQQVFARLDRRPKIAGFWGGAAIAALFISALSVLPTSQLPERQQALSPQPQALSDLMVALNSAVVEIPKTVEVLEKALDQSEPLQPAKPNMN